jgi:hypothetical protein
MNYTQKVNYFQTNVERRVPRPDVDTVIKDVFPALAKTVVASAESMSYVMIERVRELQEMRKFDDEMKLWVWRNFKIGIFKLMESFTTISNTHPNIFKKVLHEENCETVMAMFLWSLDPYNKDEYNLVKMFLNLMYESEMGDTRYTIDYQKVYRMIHYLIDTFGFEVLRDRVSAKSSAKIYDAIEDYINNSYNTNNEYSLKDIDSYVTTAFKNNTFEWKYNFINSIFVEPFDN